MGSVNKVFLIGNLGRDAEQRHTPNGTAVSNFTLATTDMWTDKSGQRQERTEWHRVVVWDRQAESLQPYLTKGKQICVEGRLQTRDWNDRDGNKRSTTEIRADRITLLGSRGGDSGGGSGGGSGQHERHESSAGDGESAPPELTEDDIPF
jgi:single-strand DNA-binding protein